MRNKREFDPVHDAQGIFRKLMQATANPGRWEDVGAHAERMEKGARGMVLSLCASLLDGEVCFYTDLGGELDEEIAFLTGCGPSPLAQADFVFAGEGDAAGILRAVKAGTLTDPHDSATVLVLCGEEDPREIRLLCPGVPLEAHTRLPAAARRWLRERQRQGHEYPCGVDIVFYTEDGRVMALPRLAREAV